jgi:TPP-dependent pyruvate/acetoin dehydrogenase alpha subunit
MNLPNNFFVQNAYRLLYLIRKVEERLIDIYHTDKIKSPIHLSIGQEAVSVGVCMALKETDVVFGTYRSHALYIAKGGDLKKMIAELYGKSTGCCKGKGGSMHLADKTAGMMGTSAIVSSSIPNALGYALALKMKGHDTVVPVFLVTAPLKKAFITKA